MHVLPGVLCEMAGRLGTLGKGTHSPLRPLSHATKWHGEQVMHSDMCGC